MSNYTFSAEYIYRRADATSSNGARNAFTVSDFIKDESLCGLRLENDTIDDEEDFAGNAGYRKIVFVSSNVT